MKYKDLTDQQFIELAKLRIINEGGKFHEPIIQIQHKGYSEIWKEFVVSFVIKTKKWADCILSIQFSRFHPNEFLYLQGIGVDFNLSPTSEDALKQSQDSEPITESKLSEIRQAFADYYRSEGCSCCQNIEPHQEAGNRLGKLLKAEPYSDGSGYDWTLYSTK
jgi:hypothetical protein